METPAQIGLPPRTLQPTVKISRNVPTNSAVHFAEKAWLGHSDSLSCVCCSTTLGFMLFIFSMSKLPFVFKLSSFDCLEVQLSWMSSDVKRCQEMSVDTKRCQEMSGDVRRCQEMSGDVKRCQEMSRDVRRCQEMSGDVRRCQEMSRDFRRCQEMSGVSNRGLLAHNWLATGSFLTETWTHNAAGLQWRQMGREGLEMATPYK